MKDNEVYQSMGWPQGETPLITRSDDERLDNPVATRDLSVLALMKLYRDSLRAALAARDTLEGRVKALEEAKEKAEARVKELECQKNAPKQVNAEAEAEVEMYKRLLQEQVDATNVVTRELCACYAELGIYRHPDQPDRGPDAIKQLREELEDIRDEYHASRGKKEGRRR